MATARSKTQTPIGSSQWIQQERDQTAQFLDQEIEEFTYSARNELDWLNEHMAEIFSRDSRNFTEVFKTPGKLRGKTPRTARKKDPSRAPLTDLFAPNPQAVTSPAQRTPFYNKVAKFQVAEDERGHVQPQNSSRRSPLRVGKENADSGYQGMIEDEMDVDSEEDNEAHSPKPQATSQAQADAVVNGAQETTGSLQVGGRNTEESFVSAREGSVGPRPSGEDSRKQAVDNAANPDDEMEVDVVAQQDRTIRPDHVSENGVDIHVDEDEESTPLADLVHGDSRSSPSSSHVSDASSPEKPLLRKSSLNFASLPPRETLTGKPSLGPRASQYNSQQPPAAGDSRQTLENSSHAGKEDDELETAESVAAAYNKSTTQRLHERINMLGQTKDPRPSKSIPQGYPRLPQAADAAPVANDTADEEDDEADDDDWIAPIIDRPSAASTTHEKTVNEQAEVQIEEQETKPSNNTRIGHQKSISTTNLASPTKAALAPDTRHQKATSVSNPNMSHVLGQMHTSTPSASPGARRFPDGPLSASKSKLYSVLKSAKSIFASSAGASAQAKMEALSSPAAKQQRHVAATVEPDTSRMPGGFGDDLPTAPSALSRQTSVLSASPSKISRKTRSSTESDKKKEKEAKQKQRAEDEFDKLREKERKKAAEQKEERERVEREEAARLERQRAEAASRAESQQSANDEGTSAEEASSNGAAKSMQPAGKLRAPTRLGRPTRQPAQQSQTKPVPVNIRVASQAQRLGSVQPPAPPTSTTSHDPPQPPALTRQNSTTTRSGAASTRAGSAQPSNARVKALEAAARKKEQEDKAAERKAEQRREFERKRAAKAEDERRAELERKAALAAEQARAQEVKVAAQKQAELRRVEQQRRDREREAQKAKDAELAAALEREKATAMAAAPHPRGDVQGTLRQLGKSAAVEQANQAKAVKRPLQNDVGDEAPQRPGLQRGPASFQQLDAKRRKTGDDDEGEADERRSVMAPPKRPSGMRKETLTKFPHGYAHAPPPATHHAASMFKATVTAQHQLQLQHGSSTTTKPVPPPMHPNDTIKLSTARIPFAEPTNPPAHLHPAPVVPSNNVFKTPARPASHLIAASSKLKSSPSLAANNGENIALPEIHTDSEDDSDADGASDSDDDENNNARGAQKANGQFRAPSWVASPALRDLLTQQQLVDPESVFGPIAPLHMDDVFKTGGNGNNAAAKNAERLRRLRERGESALWTESGDAVTSAEKRRDREARARVVRDGGWSFTRD